MNQRVCVPEAALERWLHHDRPDDVDDDEHFEPEQDDTRDVLPELLVGVTSDPWRGLQ